MRKTVNTETEGVFDGRSCGSQTPPLRGEIMKKAVANSRAEAGNFLALTRKLQTFHYAFLFFKSRHLLALELLGSGRNKA